MGHIVERFEILFSLHLRIHNHITSDRVYADPVRSVVPGRFDA